MNRIDRAGMTRRELLARSVAAGGSLLVGASWVTERGAAWALEVTALKPETMATLVQMARDIYPHDRIPDDRYAVAVKGYDIADKAPMVEAGIAALDAAAQGQGHPSYLGALWEAERVAVLRAIEKGEFFRTIRAGLVTDLYNQKEIWPLFGYEGESFSQGGYIDRGFNDIAWL
ncbi:Twin-arginine translocation pathway signal [Paracoccus sp. (in: a-proteobacteria)]|uniref:Twin-arginine translocation pathway signal n=1 Tax=Paracoccus sp. TaxID=267 RepID=UPI0026E03528|nr:Twin-arginine translocation pathway signal [Paracoccus sp. (in: a-proteobacteria)]MDO5371293.1 Twin-arginine translocation pathway signal [Paracoccus sp. (in: a-proteobacteria)]